MTGSHDDSDARRSSPTDPAKTSAAPPTFADGIAAAIRNAHVELAATWLKKLNELLPVPVTAVFPTASLLDHIPGLIEHIADDLHSGATQALVANTAVVTKAVELGELRFRQQASVHQLLREYHLLADVLHEFIGNEIARRGPDAPATEALAIAGRLQGAVFVLMQKSVDTLVARYAETVARQTTRLEGFNRMVTHELRQPLGTIRSAVEVLRHPSTLEEARNRCVELIESNSGRMATITTRLLTLSSMEVNSLQTQEIDLMSIASDVVAQLAEMAEKRGVSLRLDIPSVRMVTDVARVELILVNLISNAIKYGDPAKSERWVEIAAQELGNDVRLSIRDNGVGISKEHIGRVFDGFYRAHSARDRELDADGLGLGLAIVAECARHIGANVGIDSDEGRGTTVNVSIPAYCGVTVIDDSRGPEPGSTASPGIFPEIAG